MTLARSDSFTRCAAEDKSVDGASSFILRVVREVRVDAEGDSHVAVSESLANHFDVLPVVEEQRRVRMTKVVESDTWNLRLLMQYIEGAGKYTRLYRQSSRLSLAVLREGFQAGRK